MNEYLIEKTTLTNIGNEIRTLVGINTELSPKEMSDNINEVNTEVNSQTNLIEQIATALEGKTGGSSVEITLQDKTITPNTTEQIVTADSGYDGLGEVTVEAIPNTYVEPTSTKVATTYTPSTTDQTIAAGTYCSGKQTIKGDANLIPANIVSGKTIFDVTGTASGGGGGSGNVETCTVVISGPFEFIYNSVSAGNIIGSTKQNPYNETITVPCSSLIAVYDYQMMSGVEEPITINGVVTIYDGTLNYGLLSVFQVSSVPNSECALRFEMVESN